MAIVVGPPPEGNKKNELSPTAGLLLGVLQRAPRSWSELLAMGFAPADLAAAFAELALLGGYAFLIAPSGCRLEQDRRKGGQPNGQEAA
jgi:hypothetical protein